VQTRAERTRLVYGVKVSFLGSNPEEILKPGMTIEVALPRAERRMPQEPSPLSVSRLRKSFGRWSLWTMCLWSLTPA